MYTVTVNKMACMKLVGAVYFFNKIHRIASHSDYFKDNCKDTN